MRTTAWLVMSGAALACAVALVVTGWRQPRPSLDRTLRRLRRPPARTGADGAGGFVAEIVRHVGGGAVARSWAPSLRLIGRSVEAHVGALVAAALIGFVAPTAGFLTLRSLGAISVGAGVPLLVSLATAFAAPAIVHADAMGRADDARIDVRYQLSAYLDMVIMLLAGNTGHEGALGQAARAGDGLLFHELRRRMREVGATGQSLVEALVLVADDYDLVELRQVAGTTSLAAAQGAPVARTLSAKCSTLRGTISAEQEANARVRTDKVTPPLVGMALLFMALLIYPALSLT